MSLLTTYISRALDRATFERLDDGSYVGEVPGLQGVLANAATHDECRDELARVVEGWVLFRIANGLPVPAIDGVTVKDVDFNKKTATIDTAIDAAAARAACEKAFEGSRYKVVSFDTVEAAAGG